MRGEADVERRADGADGNGELERLIGVTVVVGDPLVRVELGKKVDEDEEQVGSFAIAIGLGIDD